MSTKRTFRHVDPRIVEANPDAQTVYVEDTPINLPQLAEVTHISRTYISYILCGARMPKVNLLKSIADALDMTMEELLSYIEVRKKILAGLREQKRTA